MQLVLEFLPFAILMAVTGLFAGILAGLLGIGGGIVIVPVLEFALGFYGVDANIRMQVAVATSLACIILTSLSSAKSHHAQGGLNLDVIRFWSPFIFAGALLGATFASNVDGLWLRIIFAIVALLVSFKMFFNVREKVLCDDVPTTKLSTPVPFSIGFLSSAMGIGGGTFCVPILTMMNQPIHKTLGNAAFFGFVISVPAVIGYILMGYEQTNLPIGSVGFVNLLGFALISPFSVLAAPLGVKLAHKLSDKSLTRFFGGFLFVVAIRMFYAAFAQ